MNDGRTERLVEQIVAEKCRAGEMFTALDVSLEAKWRGSAERHRSMKHVVHRCFEQGGMGAPYVRILIAIPGAPIPAWLYYRYDDDPHAYEPLDRSAFSAPAWSRSTARGTGTGPSRLRVPARLLRQAGIYPGEGVFVVADPRGDCFVLTSDRRRAATAGIVGRYRVDKRGVLRLGQGTVLKAVPAGKRRLGCRIKGFFADVLAMF